MQKVSALAEKSKSLCLGTRSRCPRAHFKLGLTPGRHFADLHHMQLLSFAMFSILSTPKPNPLWVFWVSFQLLHPVDHFRHEANVRFCCLAPILV